MSNVATSTAGIEGRSPWAEARTRFLGNRAAAASCLFLAVMALACLVGPAVTGHPYDRVYQDYVRTPASLTARPAPADAVAAMSRLGARMRATVLDAQVTGDTIRFTLTALRPIDERLLAYVERSDLFGPARIIERRNDGAVLIAEAPIEYRRFLFGTDANGRDLLTRTLVAGRISLAIGLLATLVALVIGVTYGAVAGYLGGRTDLLMMRAVDILYALPFIFFVILLVVFFGRNVILMFLAVGAIEWLDMARIVRGQTLSLRRQEYVQAAESLGVDTWGILKRHIVPNLLGPVVVYMTLLVPRVILLESFLSFLGLGVQEPMTSWGVLIADGARNIQGATWMLTFPALFLVATLFALNFIGDGLRDALDPKDR
ncbi:MAG: ABC transporter permease subunit [Hyphomicrobiaceae bacterium]